MKLVIVESPAKCNKIEGFLGKGYKCIASMGHIRNLKQVKRETENMYSLKWINDKAKQKTINTLQSQVKQSDIVYLAADPDREGEAIAASVRDVCKLAEGQYKRITFNSITKKAVLDAVENPRSIDQQLLGAANARRALDQLVGFSASPLLWQHIAKGLSAGRCQSPTLKILVDNHRKAESYVPKIEMNCNGEWEEGFKSSKSMYLEQAMQCKEKWGNVQWLVGKSTQSEKSRNPPPPYTTSTFQQDVGNILGISPKQSMQIAQKLYEAGHITYMRTDLPSLSPAGIHSIKQALQNKLGQDFDKYVSEKIVIRKAKDKHSQEAHEAIRPTHPEKEHIGEGIHAKVYNMIWKRAVGSCMKPWKWLETSARIYPKGGVDTDHAMTIQAYKTTQLGFTKITGQSHNESYVIPPKGTKLYLKYFKMEPSAKGVPSRLNSVGLVQKLEASGIGRPSTYATLIDTLLSRGYAIEDDIEEKVYEGDNIKLYQWKENQWQEKEHQIKYGKCKKRFIPTKLGFQVSDWLNQNVPNMMDAQFTSNMEDTLDKIANGQIVWQNALEQMWIPYLTTFKQLRKMVPQTPKIREIGIHPETNQIVSVLRTKYGPTAMLKNQGDQGNDEKVEYIGLDQNVDLDQVSLDDILKIERYPKNIGTYKEKEVTIHKGKFGFYAKWNNISVNMNNKQHTIEKVIEALNDKGVLDGLPIKYSDNLMLNKGPYGYYLRWGTRNISVPKDIQLDEWRLKTKEQIEEWIRAQPVPQKSFNSSASRGRAKGRGRGRGRG